jgi:hypothetical protein
VEAHLGGLFEEAPAEGDRLITEEIDALPSAGDADLREGNAANKDWISREGAQDRSFKGTSWRQNLRYSGEQDRPGRDAHDLR